MYIDKVRQMSYDCEDYLQKRFSKLSEKSKIVLGIKYINGSNSQELYLRLCWERDFYRNELWKTF